MDTKSVWLPLIALLFGFWKPKCCLMHFNPSPATSAFCSFLFLCILSISPNRLVCLFNSIVLFIRVNLALFSFLLNNWKSVALVYLSDSKVANNESIYLKFVSEWVNEWVRERKKERERKSESCWWWLIWR